VEIQIICNEAAEKLKMNGVMNLEQKPFPLLMACSEWIVMWWSVCQIPETTSQKQIST
jgi:hypothetical protein